MNEQTNKYLYKSVFFGSQNEGDFHQNDGNGRQLGALRGEGDCGKGKCHVLSEAIWELREAERVGGDQVGLRKGVLFEVNNA